MAHYDQRWLKLFSGCLFLLLLALQVSEAKRSNGECTERKCEVFIIIIAYNSYIT